MLHTVTRFIYTSLLLEKPRVQTFTPHPNLCFVYKLFWWHNNKQRSVASSLARSKPV
jgi:hypothetical protein